MILQRLPRCHTWVFTATTSWKHPECGRQISETRLLRYLKGVLRKLGFPGHLHTFRNAFIANALTRGVAEAIVRRWVGHVDSQILRLYTHMNDQASQSAMRAMNRTVVRREEEADEVDQK
jgi:site-specific recombinase XerD